MPSPNQSSGARGAGIKTILAAGLALSGWGMTAKGEVLLNDAFDYANGPLITVSAGKWLHHSPSGSSTGQVEVASGRVFLNHSEAEDVHAGLQGAPYSSGSALGLYVRFTVNFSSLPDGAASSYFAHSKDNTTSGYRARIFTTTNGAPAGTLRLGVGNAGSSPTAILTNNLSLGSNYTVVMRYVISNATTTLWLDPATDLSPSVTATDSASALSVSGFALRQPSSVNDGVGYGNLFLDDLMVGTAFTDVVAVPTNSPPIITGQPQSLTVLSGANALFAVSATGSPPLSFQWQFNSTNLAGATNASLRLTNVTAADAGEYRVTVTNLFGTASSQPAMLTVNPPASGFSLLTYNVGGNGANDWSTNAPQVQAIARQLQFLNPDIITFQEIPFDLSYEMTNFVSAFLPGYALARNSGTDGAIRSMIASRWPITRSSSWLDGIDLRGFGYSNANNSLDNFTRDLFEAEVVVPGFPQPLHVLTTHLKATSGTTYEDAAAKRAAEAAAITNFLATNLLTLYPHRPYVLTGDLNDSNTNALAVQYLISAPTGLWLTNPTEPSTGSINTFSIRASLSSRLDYIFPGGLLGLNIAASQVFRSDLLANPPPPLLATDSATASDHLPVLVSFNNPYDKPFRIRSIVQANQTVTLTWDSVPGQPYQVEDSVELVAWRTLASNHLATETNSTLTTSISSNTSFFRVYRAP
jgi:endonuclease/exonuclease/phosphatase family metal-dependent hydrolase